MIWNPGEGTDLNEGGAGTDTVEVNGGNGAETFTVTANGTRVRFDRVSPGPVLPRHRHDREPGRQHERRRRHVHRRQRPGHADPAHRGRRARATTRSPAATATTCCIGGDGNDTDHRRPRQRRGPAGGRRRHVRLEPRRRQRHRRGPGRRRHAAVQRRQHQREDRPLGQRPAASGSPATSATSRWTSTASRRIDFNALGGADTITVNDLSGTDVTQVNLDLAGAGRRHRRRRRPTPSSSTAPTGPTRSTSPARGASFAVAGLPAARARSTAPKAPNDSLVVNALGGNDAVDASAPAGRRGQADRRRRRRQRHRSSAATGTTCCSAATGTTSSTAAGATTWPCWGPATTCSCGTPGDGSDIVEGQAGDDTLLFNGANISENIDVSANGSRVRFTRDVGNIVDGPQRRRERSNFNALGGADTITVNDLTGTDVTQVNLDLAASGRRPATARPTPSSSTAPPGDDRSMSPARRRRRRRHRPGRPR